MIRRGCQTVLIRGEADGEAKQMAPGTHPHPLGRYIRMKRNKVNKAKLSISQENSKTPPPIRIAASPQGSIRT